MNSRIKQFLPGTEVRFWPARLLAFGLLVICFGAWVVADDQHASPGLTVHEWGTFTAIAGNQGQAVEWTPFTRPTDLPGFVEHLGGTNLKPGLRGTIRMETPVLYFYSPRDVSVSVSVAFSKGVITEWYPRAARVQPSEILRTASVSELQTDGRITWNGVTVSPNLSGEFPREVPSSPYYAARQTSSAPLRVKTTAGDQQEKFLFYRGVSAAPLPLSATQNADGELMVKSLSEDGIPAVILFERRGERVGYRLARAPESETILDPPVLTGSVDSLCGNLEGILVDQGLYPDEAHAMVETWRDSWFEEGSRLIYIVPRRFIDKVLPLAINPAPEQIVRVFVGRLEIVTPATAGAVETALASGDEVTLKKYDRFLEPILRTIREGHPESSRGDPRGR
jgi:hypothetical protein